jgi:acyl dehydratase
MAADPPFPQPSAPRVLEDIQVGEVWQGGPVRIDARDIIAFAEAYDPQPIHIDAAAAEAGPFHGLIASGWHVAALTMNQLVQSRPYGTAPLLGLGVDELRWLRPVRPGDDLLVRSEVVAVTRSRSKPDRGTVRIRIEVANQDGEIVMSLIAITQLSARTDAEAP